MASPASQSTSAPVVSIKDVTHRYGSVAALNGISLDIPGSLMVGIIGPDGVGKSTLMAIVAGSKKLQQGNVTVLGGDIADAQHRGDVCPRIAYMPQGLGKNLYLGWRFRCSSTRAARSRWRTASATSSRPFT